MKDKYLELKNAYASGKLIEAKTIKGNWITIRHLPSFNLSVERYRIKQ